MSNLPMDPTFALLARQPRKILRDANAAREAVFAARRETRPYSNLDLQIEDHHVPLANEEKTQILVRIYRGKNTTGTLPVLLYLHGGGFIAEIISLRSFNVPSMLSTHNVLSYLLHTDSRPRNLFPQLLQIVTGCLSFFGTKA
jgi:hypothetical protein